MGELSPLKTDKIKKLKIEKENIIKDCNISTDLNVYIMYGSISRKDYKLLLHKFAKKGAYQRNTK